MLLIATDFNSLFCVNVFEAYLEELHSVYISSCGKVWTCGMGQNGRLGSGSNKSWLIPQQVKTQDKCVAAAIGVNHTLLLLENHVVRPVIFTIPYSFLVKYFKILLLFVI